ncbi:hypothetical protein BDP55DRAFT_636663 [Colletotrichum godetiae]|uniref:Uncharacterized protein n=1 Tax=Colletotrichum godetiae TaxID=1209918 RepID=A0AAJ0EQS6_9PEZI|nr:uncharacterized protein BDP55DRAFT_636663 [Colletotrichum godetiae]KAK1659837.1 hypothetical protein BDP55DRAFT_636663 [Colletotrichum godetiae]
MKYLLNIQIRQPLSPVKLPVVLPATLPATSPAILPGLTPTRLSLQTLSAMDDSALGNSSLSVDYESLFSVKHDLATHDERLKSSQAFLAVRRDCEAFVYELMGRTWGTLKRRHRTIFEEGVHHIISGSREGQALLPLVHGECTKCVDTLIVACSILSKLHFDRIREAELMGSLAALLKATVRTKVNSKIRLAFVQAAKGICEKNQSPNSELLSNTFHFRKQDISSPI